MGEQGLASMVYGSGEGNSVKHYYAGTKKKKETKSKKKDGK